MKESNDEAKKIKQSSEQFKTDTIETDDLIFEINGQQESFHELEERLRREGKLVGEDEEEEKSRLLKERYSLVASNMPSLYRLGEKSFFDSDLMEQVKTDVERIETFVRRSALKPLTPEILESMLKGYCAAAASCKRYIEKRTSQSTKAQRRRAKVEEALEELQAGAVLLTQAVTALKNGDPDAPHNLVELLGLKENEYDLPKEEGAQQAKAKKEKTGKLSSDGKEALKILNMLKAPSVLIADNYMDSNKREMADMFIKLEQELALFPKDAVYAAYVKVGDQEVRLVQESDNSLSIEEGGFTYSLKLTAHLISDTIREDATNNIDLYGRANTLKVCQEVKVQDQDKTPGELSRDNLLLQNVIMKLGKCRRDQLANATTLQLRETAIKLVRGKKVDIKTFLDKLDENKALTVNSMTVEQNVKAYRKMSKNQVDSMVSFKENIFAPKEAEKNNWEPDEQKIIDLAADLVFSKDSVETDDYKLKPKERIKKVLVENREVMSMLVKDVLDCDRRKAKRDKFRKEIRKEFEDLKAELRKAEQEIADMDAGKISKKYEGGLFSFLRSATGRYDDTVEKRGELIKEIAEKQERLLQIEEQFSEIDKSVKDIVPEPKLDITFDENGAPVVSIKKQEEKKEEKEE